MQNCQNHSSDGLKNALKENVSEKSLCNETKIVYRLKLFSCLEKHACLNCICERIG